MIDVNKIKKGAGTLILVVALAAGGVAFSNYENYSVGPITAKVVSLEDNIVKNVSEEMLNKDDEQNLLDALSYVAPQESPIWIVPEIIPYNGDCEAVIVPYGYSVYKFKNDLSGVLGVEIKDDSIWYIGSSEHSMSGCFGIKNEYMNLFRLLDSLPEAVKKGTASKDLYIELDKTVADNGMKEIRVPQGYKLFYIGNPEQMAGMLGVALEKDGVDVTMEVGENNANLSLWDTEVVTIPDGYSTDYIGLPSKLANALDICKGIKNEMETYYNGLQQKAIY